ncbi:hypothetical protein A9W99_18660 [Mycobacterium sp. 1164966.3]|nr:hypothetical protein A9W99_18660 [Mycobacterium sp. 1164966.3]
MTPDSGKDDATEASQVDFGQLLAMIGHTESDRIAICSKPVGGEFMATVVTGIREAVEFVNTLRQPTDVWFGVNSRRSGLQRGQKGSAADCVDLVALWADLDVGEGKCPDYATCDAIIDDLSEILGTAPVAVVHSGHGLHPYWRLSDEVDENFGIASARELMDRWGNLVRAVAAKYLVAKIDNVFNLDRILRVPGTLNYKDGQKPCEVIARRHGGEPISIAEVISALDRFGIGHDECARANTAVVYADVNGDDENSASWVNSDAYQTFSPECLVERVKNAADGRRNTTLFGAAKDAARQGDLSEDLIAGLTSAARKSGLAEAEISSTIRSAESSPDIEPTQIDEDAFWAARDELRRLRQFARARRVGPWAVFGYALARAVAVIPPTVVLPPLVGSHASLNMFVALVGPSGAGKGGASGAAADWLDTDEDVFTATVGSGEGLAKVFAFKQRVGKTGPWVQHGLRAAVLFDAPEVDNLIALTNRNSATLLPQLRSAYSGEELGFSYADPAKAVRLCAHRYRLCLTVGVQPGRGRALLDDADGGTPQRFVWLPSDDADAPDEVPDLPAGRHLPRWPQQVGHGVTPTAPQTQLDIPVTPAALRELGVPDVAKRAVDFHRVAMLRGSAADPLDGHRLLCRLKVAVGLMWLGGRTDQISDDDWHLAGIVMAVSDRTRRGVVALLRSKANAENLSRGRAEGVREAVKSGVVRDSQIQRVADKIVRKLKESGGELARSELRRAIRYGDRAHFDDAEAILVDSGRVDKLPSVNSGPEGFVLRLSGEEASK